MKSDLPPEIRAEIKAVMAVPGLYLLKDDTQPAGWLIPVVSMNGKIFAMKIDQELVPDGFTPTVSFKGPIT